MPKMLVVDDEVEICGFLKEFFQDREFEVLTANSGEDALVLLEKNQPEIVLLDMKMPGIDGLEVLKNIKHNYPMIKVIMVTAVESSDKIEEALNCGADNYITKPLSLEYLESDVREKIKKLSNNEE